MFWTSLLLALLTLLLVKLYKIVTFWSGKGIPYEPFLEALHRTFWENAKQNPFDVYDKAVQKNGKKFGSYRGLTPVLVLSDMDLVRDVFIKQFTNFYRRTTDTEFGDKLWDNFLTVLPREHWKAVRSLIGQCLTTSKLKGMIPKFDRMAKRSVDKLVAVSDSKDNEITLNQFIKSYGLDSVVAAAFGVDLRSDEDPDNAFIKNASDLFNPSFGSYVYMFAPKLLKYLPFVDFPRKQTSEFFKGFGKHILDEKRKNLDKVMKDGTADIMDNFLIAQREDPNSVITDDVLTSQAFLFYLGGVDTTVSTLEVTTYFMTIHPEVQEKVVEEIKQVMGGREQVEYDDVQNMKYLDATIQESLRFYPIFFVTDRVCNQDTTVGRIPIQTGTIVEVPNRVLHFDPELFPEPQKFMPERFLKGNFSDSGTQAFFAFGEGPKSCVGRRLAVMNLQVLIVNMLRRVKLETCESTPKSLKLKPGMNLSNATEDPLILKIVPRVWNTDLKSN